MTVPTRIIEKEEFNELSAAEGDMLPLFKLTNIPFNPPLPDGLEYPKFKQASINILLMNVSEPVIYKDREHKQVYVIMNGYDHDSVFTYENFQDCHYIKNEWAYCLHPSTWDMEEDLDDAYYVFKHETREGQGLDEV